MRGLGSSLSAAAAYTLVVATASTAMGEANSPRLNDGAAVPSFTAKERAALMAGGVVPRPMRFQHRGGRYIGGVSYQIVNAPPEVVYATLSTVSLLPETLPNTFAARRVDEADSIRRVELTQGNAFVRATYTVCVVADPMESRIQFWLDPERPHGIADAWGYFRAQPLGADRSLVAVAVALNLGSGLARLLFEDAVQTVALATPHHIREFVEPRYLALR